MYRQEPDNLQTLLACEDQLPELIYVGASLSQILNRVCTAIDEQLRSVVSLVLLPDDAEHTLHAFEQSAATFGLTLFSCAPILSPEAEFLGTLETYSCFPRKPTTSESALIERAVNLAALAIEYYKYELEVEDWPLDWTGAAGRRPCEELPSTN